MTEWKTYQQFTSWLKGNEEFVRQKYLDGKFELFTCTCLSHFDNRKERDEHLETHSGWRGHSSAELGDSDYKDGGTTFESLICDLCDQKKTSVFERVLGGFVFCSECSEKNISKFNKEKIPSSEKWPNQFNRDQCGLCDCYTIDDCVKYQCKCCIDSLHKGDSRC